MLQISSVRIVRNISATNAQKVHQHFAVMDKHKFIQAEDEIFLLAKYDMRGLDHCKEHQKPLEFFCEDEDKLCCSSCAILGHRKCHSVVEIEQKAKEDTSNTLNNLKEELFNIDSKASSLFERLTKAEQKLTSDSNIVVDTIQTMQAKANNMFEDLKQKISKDIGDFQQQARTEIDLRKTSVDNNIAADRQSLIDIENVKQQGTPAQQFVLTHCLREQIKQLQAESQKNASEFRDTIITFQFDESLNMLHAQNIIPGKLTMKYVTVGEEPRDNRDNQQDKQTLKVTMKQVTVNLKLLASIDLKQDKENKKEPLYTGLDFLPDGRLVAVDNKNCKCIVYNQQLQVEGSFTLAYRPLDIVAVCDDEVAVTIAGELEVLILKVNTKENITLHRTMTVNIQYDSICMVDDSNFIVGTIDDPQPVRVVSTSGEEKKLLVSFPDKTYPVDHCACTYIKHCNKVVLTGRYAHTVYIYDIVSNTRVEAKNEKIIKQPIGVAVGPGDCIFVCSDGTNSIVQISHTGQILSSHALNMWYTRSVCVSDDNKLLAVSNNAISKRKLQLYSIKI